MYVVLITIALVCYEMAWQILRDTVLGLSGYKPLPELMVTKFYDDKVIVLVLVLVDKYSGTRTSTGTSTDSLWYICDVRVKTIIPLK